MDLVIGFRDFNKAWLEQPLHSGTCQLYRELALRHTDWSGDPAVILKSFFGTPFHSLFINREANCRTNIRVIFFHCFVIAGFQGNNFPPALHNIRTSVFLVFFCKDYYGTDSFYLYDL